MKKLFIFLFILPVVAAFGQTKITGVVTDARTGEALPFVSIYSKNTSVGTTTDVDGKYAIKLTNVPDSLTASFVGYLTQSQPINKGAISQVINFALGSSSVSLNEILITPGENPAFRIIRQAVAHKKANDKRQLTAYNYEAYTKMQFSMANLTQNKKRFGVKSAVTSIIDTSSFILDDSGKRVLPVFISEAISDYYYNRDPKKVKEEIKATKVTGIGIQDGSLVAQVIGNSYQDYNFYQNWVSVMQKGFISPIADGWKSYYDYDLEDSLFVGDTWCYKIKVTQKRPQDLAFNGYIWVADSSFALRKVDLAVSKSANINFIDSIHLHQEEKPTAAGAWLPVKTGLAMQLKPQRPNQPAVFARIFISNRNIEVNKAQKLSFFQKPIALAPNAQKATDEYWSANRHDSLTTADQMVYAAIDSIKSAPRVKRATNIINVLATGYIKAGKISFGPYPYTYAYNNIEGHRFQGGFKTNIDFSKKWVIAGFGAYGTKDQKAKFGGSARYIISRNHWSEAGVSFREDLQQMGMLSDKLANSPFYVGFSRFGTLEKPVFLKESKAYIQREILQGLTYRIDFTNRAFNPQYDFAFYDLEKELPTLTKNFTTSELSFLIRYANNEKSVVNDNDRISLGNGEWPVFTYKYSRGLKNAFGSTIDFRRMDLGITQRFQLGRLGKTYYRFEAGKVLSPVPYPLLELHLGNETLFYYEQTFNLMRNAEFATDTYASLHLEQHFEGLLLNSLPLIKKLKWRILGSANVLYGSLSKENLALIPPVGINGTPQLQFKSLSADPYAEVAYGIENIFRVLRVDAFHRLTYLSDPTVKKFGLKFSFQFKL